jgi:UDP-N-acetyl-D-mannosaminuronate dehydrogenase
LSQQTTLVIGEGEIGLPIAEILSSVYNVITKDIDPIPDPGKISVLHICYPFQIEDFVETTIRYIKNYAPEITMVHSTVVPGTTKQISEQVSSPVIYSPVRGKHSKMAEELLSLRKYVSSTSQDGLAKGIDHLEQAKIKTEKFSSVESLELAKIQETTYFGLLIAWAQEMKRYSDLLDADYEEVARFALADGISYMPSVIFQPGFIGGHCVMPNIELLETIKKSSFLDAIKESNDLKKSEWLSQGQDLEKRLKPSDMEN